MVLDALWSGPWSPNMGALFWAKSSSRSDPTDNDQVLGVHAQTSGMFGAGARGGAETLLGLRSLQGARTPVASARIACRRLHTPRRWVDIVLVAISVVQRSCGCCHKASLRIPGSRNFDSVLLQDFNRRNSLKLIIRAHECASHLSRQVSSSYIPLVMSSSRFRRCGGLHVGSSLN